MGTPLTVVGLGEILWDLLPSGRQLGGAPANFAYASHLLGARACVASRIGNDELGKEIRALLAKSGISDQFVQIDNSQPTGTVNVQLDAAGQPQFEIKQPVAWDCLEWTDDWHSLASTCDAVCFGSLAQRSVKSRDTVLKFLKACRSEAVRMYDVNLRQTFYSVEIIRESLKHATAVKLSHEEAPRVKELLSIDEAGDLSLCRRLIEDFDLDLVCITRGSEGSFLCDLNVSNEHCGYRVKVKDTVGAGDAFTAALINEYLRKRSLAEMNDTANRMGAWVASQSGAMPTRPKEGIDLTLRSL